MEARGIIEIFSGNQFFLYVVKLSGKPVHVPKHMIVAYASNSPKCIGHFRGTEPEPPGIPDEIKIMDTMRHESKRKVVAPTESQGSKELSGVQSKMKPTLATTTENKIQNRVRSMRPVIIQNIEPSQESRSSRGSTSEEGNQASTPLESENVIHTMHYEPMENMESQIFNHEDLGNATRNSNTKWRDAVKISENLRTFRIFKNVIWVQRIWNVYLGNIKDAQHWIDLVAEDTRPIPAVLYRAGPRSIEFEQRENNKMLDLQVIEPAWPSGLADCIPTTKGGDTPLLRQLP